MCHSCRSMYVSFNYSTLTFKDWLAEMGHMFYQVKEHGFGHRERRLQDLKEKNAMDAEMEVALAKQKETEPETFSAASKTKVVEAGKTPRFGLIGRTPRRPGGI
jgi:hypothetical protein